MLTFNHVLAKAPMQLYSAGLLFSPLYSIFRKSFSSQAPTDLEIIAQLPLEWNACTYTLEGHSRWVNSVVFSPDGSRVASGSGDKTIRVWDVQTGQCQHTLEGHSEGVNNVVFSPDGSRVASSSEDKTVRVWDVQTGQCQHTLEGHSHVVYSMVFSPDGLRVASGSGDKTVRVWDVQTGQCQYTLEGHSGAVSSVVFSPDGLRVASGSWDNTVRVWDVASWTEILCYDAGTHQQYIEFSHDSSNILVNGNLLSIPLQIRFPSTIARTSGAPPNLLVSKLGIKGDWITLSSQRILWLPPEYRPGHWASKNDTITIGSGTGRVTIVRYAATHSSSL